jgi:hypothetical protein
LTTVVRGVQLQDVREVWSRVEPLVVRALQRANGDFGIDDVLASLQAGSRQLFVTWPALDAIAITQNEKRRSGLVLHVFAMAGRLPANWRDILSNLEQWAADQGCIAVELRGRRGWARLMPDYDASMVFMRKEIQ